MAIITSKQPSKKKAAKAVSFSYTKSVKAGSLEKMAQKIKPTLLKLAKQ